MYVYIHKWYTRPKEKDLRALPIQIPSNVAEKKSFTIKPPQDCSGSSTIGILFLELINQTWRKLYSHSHPKWSQTRIWGLHSLASWTLFSFLRRLPQIAAGARWTLDQIYVTKVIKEVEDVKTNKKGGATISVRRRGGWVASYELAEKLAGWK